MAENMDVLFKHRIEFASSEGKNSIYVITGNLEYYTKIEFWFVLFF